MRPDLVPIFFNQFFQTLIIFNPDKKKTARKRRFKSTVIPVPLSNANERYIDEYRQEQPLSPILPPENEGRGQRWDPLLHLQKLSQRLKKKIIINE